MHPCHKAQLWWLTDTGVPGDQPEGAHSSCAGAPVLEPSTAPAALMQHPYQGMECSYAKAWGRARGTPGNSSKRNLHEESTLRNVL